MDEAGKVIPPGDPGGGLNTALNRGLRNDSDRLEFPTACRRPPVDTPRTPLAVGAQGHPARRAVRTIAPSTGDVNDCYLEFTGIVIVILLTKAESERVRWTGLPNRKIGSAVELLTVGSGRATRFRNLREDDAKPGPRPVSDGRPRAVESGTRVRRSRRARRSTITPRG